MGVQNWSTLAGYTQRPSPIPNLPPTFPSMEPKRTLGKDIGQTVDYACQRWKNRPDRGFYGRQLFSSQKRGSGVGKTKKGKGTKIMGITDGNGIPIAICTHAANTHEVKLVEKTIGNRFGKKIPRRIIADKAYDSDSLDKTLKNRKIELIAPHKANRKRKDTQDGRPLRRYARRWKVERTFAWIHNWRRCVVRYDYHLENFTGFVLLAVLNMYLKRLF